MSIFNCTNFFWVGLFWGGYTPVKGEEEGEGCVMAVGGMDDPVINVASSNSDRV